MESLNLDSLSAECEETVSAKPQKKEKSNPKLSSKSSEISKNNRNNSNFESIQNTSENEEIIFVKNLRKQHKNFILQGEEMKYFTEVKTSSSKKKFALFFFICLIILSLVLVPNLILANNKTSDSKKVSQGEIYLMKCNTKSTVSSSISGKKPTEKSVDSNSTYTLLIYNLTEENMNFMLIEGIFYSMFEENNINMNLSVLDEMIYVLVDSVPETGEINSIAYPNHLKYEKAEFLIPIVKAFLINYRSIEGNDTEENSQMKKSIEQDKNFFYMKRNFQDDEIKGKIFFNEKQKIGKLKGVKVENFIKQKVSKKDLKVKKSQNYLKVDLKMFENSKFLQDISIVNMIEAKIELVPVKLNDRKIDSIYDFLGNRRFQVLDENIEGFQDSSQHSDDRELIDDRIIIKEKVISYLFGNPLVLKIKIGQQPGDKTFEAFLILNDFFESKICQGTLPEIAIKNIRKFYELKGIINSKSRNILINVNQFFKDITNINKLLYNDTSFIKLIDENIRLKRKKYLFRISNFLENFSLESSFEEFTDSTLNEFLSDHSNLLIRMRETSLIIYNIHKSLLNVGDSIGIDSESLMHIVKTYENLPGITSFELDGEELLKFDKLINNKVEIETYFRYSSLEHELASNDITKQVQDYKNNLIAHFKYLEERLLETCFLYNNYSTDLFLSLTNCSEIEKIIKKKLEISIFELESSLNNLFRDIILDTVENTKSLSVSYIENVLLSLPSLTNTILFNAYSLECKSSKIPQIKITVKVPGGILFAVPIDIEYPTSRFNYFLFNESLTSVNTSIESNVTISGSAFLVNSIYEIGAIFDAVFLLCVNYEIGYNFPTMQLFNQGYQVTYSTRKTSLYYKLASSTTRTYLYDQNEVNQTIPWNYLPLTTFSLI